MIPIRVCVEGFMCYRDRAEFVFDGAPIWVLTGKNGMGKSAVFDAITYVLYGSHRLGRSEHVELISKNSPHSNMAVEFDFAIDDRRFRAKRTHHLTNRPTFQAWEFIGGFEEENLVAIPGTEKKAGFQEWVIKTVGLDEKAFKSAILLRQGEADALLKADPRERHPVLAQIVDLSKYEKLHKRAAASFDVCKKEYEKKDAKLKNLLPVNQSDIQKLIEEIENAEQELKAINAALEEKIELKVYAANWEKLVREKDAVEDSLAQFERLLAEEKQIRADADRYEDLKSNLPILEKFLAVRRKIEELKENLSDYEKVINRIESLKFSLRQIQTIRHELPHWKRYREERDNWQQAKTELGELENGIRRTTAEIVDAENKHTKQAQLLREAENERDNTRFKFERAQFSLDETEKKKKRFSRLEGKAKCDACGQPLNEEHRIVESAKLAELLAEAEKTCYQAKEEYETALENFDTVRQQASDLENRLAMLKQKNERNSIESGNTKTAKVQAENNARTSLNSIYESAVKQLGQIENIEICFEQSFPTENDLIELQSQSRDYDQQNEELDSLRNRQTEMAGFQGELKSLEQEIKRLKSDQPDNWKNETEKLTENDLNRLRNERTTLESSQQKLLDLQTAKSQKTAKEERLDEIIKDLNGLNEKAKRTVAEIETEIIRLRGQKIEAEKHKSGAESKKAGLENQQKARAELEKEQKEARYKADLYKKLSELLGRDRLQRWLLRGAEETIVHNANNFLERMSNRSIELKLKASSSEDDASIEAGAKALDLLANYQIEEANFVELPVDSLSGGQRFRVAVSLALGIGQYASTGTRRLESVIIDEGFGSLDTEGRGEMIEEIKSRLTDILQRIIIVSHQEEVAKAFPTNKYAISKENGTSVVKLVDEFE